jgi:hypothetical protein
MSMKIRPERPWSYWQYGGANHDDPDSPMGPVGSIMMAGRRGNIWRYADEPGIWREQATGKRLPVDEIIRYGVDPAEVAERQMVEDRERVREHIDRITRGGADEVADERRGYVLRSVGAGLYVVENSAGVALTPAPVTESVAREVLKLLAPDLAPEPTLAEALA